MVLPLAIPSLLLIPHSTKLQRKLRLGDCKTPKLILEPQLAFPRIYPLRFFQIRDDECGPTECSEILKGLIFIILLPANRVYGHSLLREISDGNE